MAGLLAAGTFLALTGGAPVSHAGTRSIDPFTITGGPNPAFVGKNVVYTISFTNASDHPLTQVQFTGDANVGTFTSSSSGKCVADAVDSSNVVCTYGKMDPGTTITDDLFYAAPSVAGDVTTMTFTGRVITNEGGGDPGSQSIWAPTGPNMDPFVLTLKEVNGNEAGDVFSGANNSVATGAVNANANALNKQSETLTVDGFTSFLIASISELTTQPTICGTNTGVTPFLDTANITVTGTFGGLVTLKTTWLKSYTPKGLTNKKFRMCHDGVVMDSGCPNPVTILNLPPNGCATVVFTKDTVEATAYDDHNGGWAGGFT